MASGSDMAGVPMMLCGTVNWQGSANSTSTLLAADTPGRLRLYLPHGSATRERGRRQPDVVRGVEAGELAPRHVQRAQRRQ